VFSISHTEPAGSQTMEWIVGTIELVNR